MTKAELLARISSQEITEWQAYHQIEPFGEKRDDLRSAQICALLANAHTEKSEKFDVDDFMPDFDGENRQSVEDQEKIVRNLQQIFGGKLEDGE